MYCIAELGTFKNFQFIIPLHLILFFINMSYSTICLPQNTGYRIEKDPKHRLMDRYDMLSDMECQCSESIYQTNATKQPEGHLCNESCLPMPGIVHLIVLFHQAHSVENKWQN